MSFLDELRKQKQKLKETDTIVTTATGRRFVVRASAPSSPSPLTRCGELERTAFGFVVDTRPDETPALVAECVYIGAQDCAADAVLLRYDIKHVLSLGVDVHVNANHKFVECLDLPETDIGPVLRDSLPFVRLAVLRKENVLIHCNAGVSRTSMVAIAYLMQCGKSFEEAHSVVKEKRPAIQPNVGFRKQLKSFVVGSII